MKNELVFWVLGACLLFFFLGIGVGMAVSYNPPPFVAEEEGATIYFGDK